MKQEISAFAGALDAIDLREVAGAITAMDDGHRPGAEDRFCGGEPLGLGPLGHPEATRSVGPRCHRS